MMLPRCFTWQIAVWIIAIVGLWLPTTKPAIANDPPPPDGTTEATKAMAAFQTPAGFNVSLYAAEPLLGAPVAICLDEQGRVYVAEEYRFNRGTEENRTRPFLLEDDLQIQTLEDRLKMFQKYADKFEGGMDWFSRYSDQVRRLEDRDGDGKAEVSTIFAGDFNDTLDGLAAGIIARDGDVYLTNIPHLWLLQDKDEDGVAEIRKPLHRGFGVNAAFLGHDLHGLAWGPDGKLYFSIGDRGFHVETYEGNTLHGPRTGAVFRCNPDGSELEVVARGMRNPQELAFDQFGNLFAVDNNCDKGDHSRLVYVVEGGDSGWNMAYQTLPPPYLTGPWHAEQIWHLPPAEHQPAWIVPPVGKIGAGPSGFAYYPGVGLPKKYDNHFFYCNYTGRGGVESFQVKQTGAGFTIEDHQDFLKPVSATDVDFGYDGKVYISDFVQLHWNGGPAKGRIYTVSHKAAIQDPLVKANQQLFTQGFKEKSLDELAELIRQQPDLRVRQRAQFELAARGKPSIEVFKKLLSDSELLPRLHAIWGLGQLAKPHPTTMDLLLPLLADKEPEVQAQAAKVLGTANVKAATEPLIGLLSTGEPRVQFFAALALAQLKAVEAVQPVLYLLRENNDQDLFIRHAGVMALVACSTSDALLPATKDASPAVRMAVLLAFRRWQDVRIAMFLNDADPRLVTEAARAINDLPLEHATPELAALLPRLHGTSPTSPEALIRRAINANFRLGSLEEALRVTRYAADAQNPSKLRSEAIAALADWAQPSQRDRVNGFWRPLESRSVEIPREAVSQQLSTLLASASGDLSAEVVKLVGELGIETSEETFAGWVRDTEKPVPTRIAALELLASRKSKLLPELSNLALQADNPLLRSAARAAITQIDVNRGISLLTKAAEQGELLERQQALAALGPLENNAAVASLKSWMSELSAGQVEPELQLDVIEAVRESKDSELQSGLEKFEAGLGENLRLARFQFSLSGGDPLRGRQLFVTHSVGQCIRCHKIGTQGGDAGPDLTHVSEKNPREYLLQSILEPNAKIAPGFATVTLLLTNGKVVAGTLKSEDNGKLTVITPQQETMVINAEDVEERSQPTSAMPDMLKALTPREVRDLVAYLSTLQ